MTAERYQDEISAFRARLLKEMEESRNAYRGQCAVPSPNYRSPYPPPPPPPSARYAASGSTFQAEFDSPLPPLHTCASYQEPRQLTDTEIYYRSVTEQNQKLLQEKQTLMKAMLSMQEELRTLKQENAAFRTKENKGKVFKDMLADAKKSAKNLVDKTIEWFNT